MLNIKAFSAILARLSKREKLVLYGAIFFVSLMFLDRLIIGPVFSKIKDLNREIEEKELNIRKNLRILSYKKRILAERDKYNSFMDKFKTEEEEITYLLKEVENLANKSSIYLIDMKPRGSKETTQAIKYLISLTAEAQMEQLIEFMYDIENSEKLLTIEKYDISPKSSESSVARCSMTVSKLSILE